MHIGKQLLPPGIQPAEGLTCVMVNVSELYLLEVVHTKIPQLKKFNRKLIRNSS